MLATDYARYHNIKAQAKGESDDAFKTRVGTVLRGKGKLIEAQEAYHDQRYETTSSVLVGISGAVAQEVWGVDYGADDMHQFGDDLASGILVADKSTPPDALILLLTLLGATR